MTADDDAAYFRRRAEQELDLAQRAVDGAVVQAHYRLAEAYLEKLETDAKSDHVMPIATDKPLFYFRGDAMP